MDWCTSRQADMREHCYNVPVMWSILSFFVWYPDILVFNVSFIRVDLDIDPLMQLHLTNITKLWQLKSQYMQIKHGGSNEKKKSNTSPCIHNGCVLQIQMTIKRIWISNVI